MCQLMHVGRNLRVSLVVCVRVRECEESSVMVPCSPCCSRLSPLIGWRSADGGEVRDVAVSLAVEMVYHRVGDLSQIARHALCESVISPSDPRLMPAVLGSHCSPPCPSQPIAVPCPGGGVSRWLSHVCGRVSATLSPPSSPHVAILGNPASRAQTSTLP